MMDDSPPDQNDDSGDDGHKEYERPEGAQCDDSADIETRPRRAYWTPRPAAAIYGLGQINTRRLLRVDVVTTADYL